MSNPPYFQPLALFLPNLPKSRKFFLPLLRENRLHFSKLQINLHLLSVCTIFAPQRYKKLCYEDTDY